MSLPESNNVYATVFPPVGLPLVEKLLREEFSNAKVWARTSGYSGVVSLHVESETAELDGFPTSEDSSPTYLLNGGLAGSEAEVIAKITSIFRRFKNAGVRMAIEAYDSNGELICSLPNKAASEKG